MGSDFGVHELQAIYARVEDLGRPDMRVLSNEASFIIQPKDLTHRLLRGNDRFCSILRLPDAVTEQHYTRKS